MTEPVSAAVAVSAAASAASPGLMAAAGGFLAGFLLTWPALIVLLAFGILFEHNGARGWAVSSALATMVVAYFFFNVSLLGIALGAVAYVVIGLVWSFYRYKRHANDVVEENRAKSDSVKAHALRDLHPKAMLGTITAWILIWPFSMVENIVGDLINSVQLLVTKFFRSVYHRVYDAAVAALAVK